MSSNKKKTYTEDTCLWSICWLYGRLFTYHIKHSEVCKTVNGVFGDYYRKSPNNKNVSQLLVISERCGFPKMLESTDWMQVAYSENKSESENFDYISTLTNQHIVLEIVT